MTLPIRRSSDKMQWVLTGLVAFLVCLFGVWANQTNSTLNYLTSRIDCIGEDVAALKAVYANGHQENNSAQKVVPVNPTKIAKR